MALEIVSEKIYIARFDMVISPYWDENQSKYFDLITYNAAIEDVAKYLELDKWHSLPAIVRSMKK